MNHATELLSDFVCLQGVLLVTDVEKFHCLSSGGRPRRIDLTDLGRGVEFVIGMTNSTVFPLFDFGDVKPKGLEALENEGWNVVDASHWTTQLSPLSVMIIKELSSGMGGRNRLLFSTGACNTPQKIWEMLS